MRVAELMKKDPVTVWAETSLADVASLTDKHFKCVPVVHDGVLVGVIGRSDLVRALASRFFGPAKASDEAIRSDILSIMARENWLPRTGIRIEVKAGIVDLEGIILSDSERRVVTVIAENAPGVKHVHDHLVYVDAGSGMPFLQQA
jgi:predicted transcriptional regulator